MNFVEAQDAPDDDNSLTHLGFDSSFCKRAVRLKKLELAVCFGYLRKISIYVFAQSLVPTIKRLLISHPSVLMSLKILMRGRYPQREVKRNMFEETTKGTSEILMANNNKL